MLKLTNNAEIHRQVEVTYPQSVHSWRSHDFIQIVQPFLGLNHADDGGVFIGVLNKLFGADRFEIGVSRTKGHASFAHRRVLSCFNNDTGLSTTPNV